MAPLAALQAAETPKAGAKPNLVFLIASDPVRALERMRDRTGVYILAGCGVDRFS
jgi:thymidylate kinase